MINDFWEIKDEKDRELYVAIRQVIDEWFITQIEQHKIKDHKAHECFNEELEYEKKCLDKLLSAFKTKNEQKVALITIGDRVAYNLMDNIQLAIVITNKANELVTKN